MYHSSLTSLAEDIYSSPRLCISEILLSQLKAVFIYSAELMLNSFTLNLLCLSCPGYDSKLISTVFFIVKKGIFNLTMDPTVAITQACNPNAFMNIYCWDG